jgi:hypothetical protein
MAPTYARAGSRKGQRQNWYIELRVMREHADYGPRVEVASLCLPLKILVKPVHDHLRGARKPVGRREQGPGVADRDSIPKKLPILATAAA